MVDVDIDGLDKFDTGIRKMDSGLAKTVDAITDDAASLIVTQVRPLIPRDTGRARASLRSEGASVVAGGPKAPYYGWLDFGGRVGRSGSVSRPYRRSGRYIYRVLAKDFDDVIDVAEDSIQDLGRKSGIVITNG